jgi:hypothetical protein
LDFLTAISPFCISGKNSKRFAFDVIAFRVIRTRRKFAETPLPDDEFRAVFRTDFVEFDRRRNRRRAAFFINLANVFAFRDNPCSRKTRRSDLFSKPSRPQARTARNFFGFAAASPFSPFAVAAPPFFAADFARRFAFRVIGAGQKLPETPEFDDHPAPHFRKSRRSESPFFCFETGLRRFSNPKTYRKTVQRVAPVDFSFFDFVELFFHPRRVSLVEKVVETGDENIVDGRAESVG